MKCHMLFFIHICVGIKLCTASTTVVINNTAVAGHYLEKTTTNFG